MGIMGLLALQRPSEQLAATGRQIMMLYKITVGVYLGWIVFWSVVSRILDPFPGMDDADGLRGYRST